MTSSAPHTANNFDFLRFFAASIVIISHSFDLLVPASMAERSGEPLKMLTGGQASFGSLGVAIFFCLSGYLITQSLFRSESYLTYFIKRALRIFPALILDLLIAVFIWGAVVTVLPLGEYFTSALTYRYLLNILLFNTISYVLPGVFEHNIYGNIVNGSLWTLPYEAGCYIGIALLHYLTILKNRALFAAFYFFCVAAGFVFFPLVYRYAIPHTSLGFLFVFIFSMYFGAGAIFFLFRDEIPLKPGIALIAFLIWSVAVYFNLSIYVNPLCLSYIIFWFVFERRIPVQNAGKYGDFSYGIYIYAFPVQQTIIYFTDSRIRVWQLLILSFIFTVPLAAFSWFAVEKKALRLKKIFVSKKQFKE